MAIPTLGTTRGTIFGFHLIAIGLGFVRWAYTPFVPSMISVGWVADGPSEPTKGDALENTQKSKEAASRGEYSVLRLDEILVFRTGDYL